MKASKLPTKKPAKKWPPEPPTIRCIVACTNSNGEPDLYFCKIETVQKRIDAGEHYKKAIRIAAREGYAGPYVAFDENDPAGKKMLKLFAWKSATSYVLL